MASGGRLIDIENEIKALIREDPSLQNPAIFQSIYDLIRLWFLRTKKITDYNILDDVAMVGAEMLFMKIYKGGSIYSWLGYISLAYQSFIREYRKLSGIEIFDEETGRKIFDELNKSSKDISANTTEISNLIDSSIITSIMNVVDDILENKSIYQKYTKKYVDARLSISLMLLTNELDNSFMDDGDRYYIRFLYNVIKEEIKNSACNSAEMEMIFRSKSDCQDYNDNYGGGEDEYIR